MTDAPRGPTTEELRARVLEGSRRAARALAGREPAEPAWIESLRRTAEAQRHSARDVHGVSVKPSHLLALLDALAAIRREAGAWHGDDTAKGRTLAVIASWSADPYALQAELDREKGERLGSPLR